MSDELLDDPDKRKGIIIMEFCFEKNIEKSIVQNFHSSTEMEKSEDGGFSLIRIHTEYAPSAFVTKSTRLATTRYVDGQLQKISFSYIHQPPRCHVESLLWVFMTFIH